MPALKWGSTNIYTGDAEGDPIYPFTAVGRIFDGDLSNGAVWQAQGSPVAPDAALYKEMQTASALAETAVVSPQPAVGPAMKLNVTLPRRACRC